jgi:hypothetical protein
MLKLCHYYLEIIMATPSTSTTPIPNVLGSGQFVHYLPTENTTCLICNEDLRPAGAEHPELTCISHKTMGSESWHTFHTPCLYRVAIDQIKWAGLCHTAWNPACPLCLQPITHVPCTIAKVQKIVNCAFGGEQPPEKKIQMALQISNNALVLEQSIDVLSLAVQKINTRDTTGPYPEDILGDCLDSIREKTLLDAVLILAVRHGDATLVQRVIDKALASDLKLDQVWIKSYIDHHYLLHTVDDIDKEYHLQGYLDRMNRLS